MPQITIEYSASLADHFDGRAFAAALHDALVRTVETQLESCKTRLVRRDDVVIADGDPQRAMIHADIRILSGRGADQKKRLGEEALRLLDEAVRRPQPHALQLTVEVRELDADNYHKRVLAP